MLFSLLMLSLALYSTATYGDTFFASEQASDRAIQHHFLRQLDAMSPQDLALDLSEKHHVVADMEIIDGVVYGNFPLHWAPSPYIGENCDMWGRKFSFDIRKLQSRTHLPNLTFKLNTLDDPHRD